MMVIERYTGSSWLVKELSNLITKKFSDMFLAVVAHGSVASDEAVNYSDFDGLLIVKDKWLGTKELAQFKHESMQIILRFDPLQHHGWFEIKESDLVCYPEDYLPLIILKNSKLIYPLVSNFELNILLKENPDFNRILIPMLNQFELRISNKWTPKNMFQLKSFMSQIMLLPSLYYSAIENKAILKRDSFDAVRTNFSKDQWSPIVVATLIRKDWNYKLNCVQKFLLHRPEKVFRKLNKKYFAPKVNSNFRSKLDDQFFENLGKLVSKIKVDLK